jgi:tripartite-type tricarboxylate transporter receptor subunit TctC
MMTLRKAWIATSIGIAVAWPAWAQTQGVPYPNKPIRLVNPYAPGGTVDLVARVIAQKLNEAWGQPVIVDNRPGAGTTIGTEIVAHAVPDGYTLLQTSGTVAANVTLFPKLSFHPEKDLAPIGMIVESPYILVVHPTVPAKSVQEFISLARARPGTIAFGSVGMGSTAHLTMELLRSHTKIDLVHVPYKGGAPSVTGVLSGEVQALFSPVTSVLALSRSGKLKAFAVSSAKRVELAPELPTVAESGLPGFESTGWYAMFAPARTPAGIVDQINGEINRLLQRAEVRERFLAAGMVPLGGPPERLAEYLKLEVVRWAKVILEAGVKPE